MKMTEPTSQAETRRHAFINNVNQLLDVARLNRKEAAEAIGVPYKWLRRMVTTGLVRSDERNLEDLRKLITYLAVPDTEDLWRPSLVCWLLESDEGEAFWSKFEKNIYSLWSELERSFQAIDQRLLRCLRWQCRERRVPSNGIAFHPPEILSVEEKVAEILISARSEHFKDVIDVYYKAISAADEQTKRA